MVEFLSRRPLLVVATALTLSGTLAAILAWLLMLPPNGRHINAVRTDRPLFALTFDDGPNPPYTERILEVLAAADARATFFVTGEHARAYPESMRRIIEGGHEIGNHSWDETVIAFESAGTTRELIARTDAAIREAGYLARPIPFRAPQGVQFIQLAGILRRQGRPHIGASVLPADFIDPDPERVARRVLKRLKPGSIVVLHDGRDSTPTADRSTTVEALRLVLESASQRGLRAVSVGELVEAGED